MTYDNPIRGRLNAWFFRLFDGYIDVLLGDRKRSLFAEHPTEIVEIGSGVGANFRYLAPGTRVVAVEPNPQMHGALRATAERQGVALELLERSADDTGLPDNSVDWVVCTLVLCTVANPTATLAEIRRILRPGGQFVFIEHVAATSGSWLRRVQEFVHRPWLWFFEGCHTHRDTLVEIRRAGFSHVRVESTTLTSPFVPVNSQISGVAVV
ncbi:MAG: class I SAM-dependent methyltransferase [Polyangiales bacterium]